MPVACRRRPHSLPDRAGYRARCEPRSRRKQPGTTNASYSQASTHPSLHRHPAAEVHLLREDASEWKHLQGFIAGAGFACPPSACGAVPPASLTAMPPVADQRLVSARFARVHGRRFESFAGLEACRAKNNPRRSNEGRNSGGWMHSARLRRARATSGAAAQRLRWRADDWCPLAWLASTVVGSNPLPGWKAAAQ